jgi:hypothetical protein
MDMVELEPQIMVDIRIRKVKMLNAHQRKKAKSMADDDLVIVRTTVQRIIGSPIMALQKSVRDWRKSV